MWGKNVSEGENNISSGWKEALAKRGRSIRVGEGGRKVLARRERSVSGERAILVVVEGDKMLAAGEDRTLA